VLLYKFCKKLDEELNFRGIDCAYSSFLEWASREGEDIPILEEDHFHKLASRWAATNDALTNRRVGFVNGKLVMFRAAFVYYGKIAVDQMSREEALALEVRLDDLVNKLGEEAGESLNKGYMTSFDNWPWLATRSSMVENAMSGIILGCCASFVVLIVLTGNWILSLIAVYSISSIILTILGTIWFAGWSFGLAESTCVIVFIGISVDYVVHICHEYVHAHQVTRQARTDAAYR